MKIVSLIFLIILLLVFSALLILLFAKVRLVLTFSKTKNSGLTSDIYLEVSGGIIKKAIPLKGSKKKKKGKTETEIKDTELSITDKLKKYYDTFVHIKNTWSRSKRSVRKRIIAEEINLDISFGTGDAAHTGIATGALWGAVYNVIGFVANFIRVTEPQIHIHPDYEAELLEFDGRCILKLSVANIISILLIVYINYCLENKKQTKKEKAAINNVNTN